MSSFNDVLGNIVTTLTGDSDHLAYCQARWGKAPTVKRNYRKRAEIAPQELPIILVTAPASEPTDGQIIGGRMHKRTVRLYCGFYQTDRTKAQEELVSWDEKIDVTLLKDRRRGATAQDTDPSNSVNDEGADHPIYFIVKDIEIETRY